MTRGIRLPGIRCDDEGYSDQDGFTSQVGERTLFLHRRHDCWGSPYLPLSLDTLGASSSARSEGHAAVPRSHQAIVVPAAAITRPRASQRAQGW